MPRKRKIQSPSEIALEIFKQNWSKDDIISLKDLLDCILEPPAPPSRQLPRGRRGGGAVGIVVLIQPNLSEGQWAAGLGLAGTAIAGAAGLAQTTKNESNITGQNAQVKVENTHPTSNEKAAG